MNKFQWILLIFLLSTSGVYTQSIKARIDAAESLIAKNKIEEGILIFQEVDSLSKLAQDSFGINASAKVLGGYYNIKGDYQRAKVYFEEALPYAQDALDRGHLLQGMSTAIDYSDIYLAEKYLLQAIAETEKVESAYELGTMYGNYGQLLEKMGRFEEAIHYFKKALGLNPSPIVRIQLNMALSKVLINTANWGAAEEYVLNSIRIAEEEGYKMRNGKPGVDYAHWLVYKGKYKEAMEELRKAKAFFTERDQEDNLAHVYFVESLVYIKTKDWQALKGILNNKKEIISSFGDHKKMEFLLLENSLLELEGNYQAIIDNGQHLKVLLKGKQLPSLKKRNAEWLSMAYYKMGDANKAFEFLKQKEVLSDSIYRSGQARIVNKLEADFNRKEQKREIENLEFKNSTQQKMLFGGGLFILLLSVFSWLLYRLWKKVSTQKITISKALGEKDILLREIHHRVKNNLQLVSSLLSLQIDSVSDEQALQAIKEGHSRVQSMALIHQDLYHKDNLTEVNGRVYLEKLTKELFVTYNIDDQRIKLELDIEDVDVDVDTLVPLGLIINELLTNTLKYAFPDNRKGLLQITLKDIAGNLTLRIKDDGVGFDPNDLREGSFGNTLIDALSGQLNANIESSSSEGTDIKISIDNYKNRI